MVDSPVAKEVEAAMENGSRSNGHEDDLPAVRMVETSKYYGSSLAVARVSLEIKQRELFTLLGSSGSGKTTILRMIAGLVRPTEGRIWIGAEEVHARPTYERNIAMVFQSLALFPHMDVFSNIAFPLRMRREGRKEIARRVRSALDAVRLPDIGERRINELSGGQQQRVALARALVYNPRLLLLDEPFGALDRRLREEMQLEIVRLHQDIDVTIINVTHDQREALMLSDRIGVMRLGRLEQVGASEDIYRTPHTHFVAQFIGDATVLEGQVQITDKGPVLRRGNVSIALHGVPESLIGEQAAIAIRTEVVDLETDASPSSGVNRFPGTIVLRAFEGAATYYEIDVPQLGLRMKASMSTTRRPTPFNLDDRVFVRWDPALVPVVAVETTPTEPQTTEASDAQEVEMAEDRRSPTGEAGNHDD